MVIAFCRKPLAGSLMISAKVLCVNLSEEATLPLRWLCQLPFCGLAADGRLQAIINRQQVYIFTRPAEDRSFLCTEKGVQQNQYPSGIRIIQRSKGTLRAGAAYQAGENCFRYDQKFKTTAENSMRLFTRSCSVQCSTRISRRAHLELCRE